MRPHSQTRWALPYAKESLLLRFALFVFVLLGAATESLVVRPQQSVLLAKPQDGAVVFDRQLIVSGTAADASRVAILIQGLTKRRPWRVASLITPDAGGDYQSTIRLTDTNDDVAYRMVAVAASGDRTQRTVRHGMTLRQPPNGLSHSKMIRLTVAGNARPESDSDSAIERILFPIHGSKVGRNETVVIEGLGDPLPVVLIRHSKGGSPWYAQQEVERVGPGRTAVEVRFGSDKATVGQRFQIRLALPRTEEERAKLVPGRPVTKLPEAIAYGRPLVVQLNPDKQPAISIASLKVCQAIDRGSERVRITYPSDGTLVSRRAVIRGVCEPPTVPVVLVHTENDQQTWYVQSPCEVNGAGFYNRVYLGRIGTPKGTQFQIVATLVPAQDALKWKAGEAITELPEDRLVSQPLRLVHNGIDQ